MSECLTCQEKLGIQWLTALAPSKGLLALVCAVSLVTLTILLTPARSSWRETYHLLHVGGKFTVRIMTTQQDELMPQAEDHDQQGGMVAQPTGQPEGGEIPEPQDEPAPETTSANQRVNE